MPPAANRTKVKEFFAWEWPAKSVDNRNWGFGLVAAGIVTLGIGIGIILIPIGFYMLYSYYSTLDLMKTPISKNLTDVINTKYSDLQKIWVRSHFKVDKPLDQLRQFDLADYNPFEGRNVEFAALTKSTSSLDDIIQRSVFLYGPAPESEIQIGVAPGKVVTEYNPINVSVLYISGNQLVVYHAIIDLCTGDLSSEAVQRIYLNEIVQVSVKTSSERIKISTDEGLLKKFNRARSTTATELVRSETLIYLTKTDGHTIDFPIGAPTVKDGTRGELDSEEVSDNRQMRIATALQQNIEAAKQVVAR